MYPLGNPTDVIREPIFVSENYRNIGSKHSYATGAPLEPLTSALTLANAQRVNAPEFRTLGGNFQLERPPANRDFRAWELPRRNARVGEDCNEWLLGVILGVSASGVSASGFPTCPQHPREFERQPFGRLWKSSVTVAKWAIYPAKRPMSDRDFRPWPTSRRLS